MIKAISVKDRLKAQAVQDGTTMQEKLLLYGLERTIYRISVSKYAEQFTLKGGIFLYALFDGNYARATADIDLLAKHLSNDIEEMRRIFQDIFSIPCDDALSFALDTLRVTNITEFKEYHGVNISIIGFLDKTRVPVSIDVGFGDIVRPDRVRMDFPVLLDMAAPQVYAYSVYSVIAEKFEAMASLGIVNGRYKDFYDIYILATHYDLDGNTLKTAVKETFFHRQTTFENIVALDLTFVKDTIHQSRWKAFIRKKNALVQVDFETVMALLRTLLIPVAEANREGVPFCAVWNAKAAQWEASDADHNFTFA